jgi:hypothetical protein
MNQSSFYMEILYWAKPFNRLPQRQEYSSFNWLRLESMYEKGSLFFFQLPTVGMGRLKSPCTV